MCVIHNRYTDQYDCENLSIIAAITTMPARDAAEGGICNAAVLCHLVRGGKVVALRKRNLSDDDSTAAVSQEKGTIGPRNRRKSHCRGLRHAAATGWIRAVASGSNWCLRTVWRKECRQE